MSKILIKIVYISFEKLIFKQCPSYDHFSRNYITVILKRATFSNPPRAETLLFLQIGFTTVLCHHSRSIVAFDSCLAESADTASGKASEIKNIHTRFTFLTSLASDVIVSSLWHCPARILCSIEGGRYPLSFTEFGLSSPAELKRSYLMNKTTTIYLILAILSRYR